MSHQATLAVDDILAHPLAREQDPPWLNELRQTARQRFEGLPVRKTEQWKYTVIAEQDVRSSGGEAAADSPGVPPALIEGAARFLLPNGELDSDVRYGRDGVLVQSLGSALEDAKLSDGPLKTMLESLPIDQPQFAWSQLNTAALERGIYVHVSAGVDAGDVLLQWPCGFGAMNHSRVCIVLEQGARMHLVEQFENGSETPARLNLVEQLWLAEDAELSHSRLQHYPEASLLINRTEARLGGSSRYSFTGIDLGAGLARHDMRAAFHGASAQCSLNAAALGSASSHVDYHLESDHLSPGCQSRQLFRAVGGGRSKLVFNGRVHVAPGADGSDSQQSSAGLLLSRTAEINAKPELEILADEVVAAHGATVGQLDPMSMFYLRSRGISEAEARKMLTLAFCRSVVDQVPLESLHAELAERLETAMDALEHDHG